MGVYCFAHVAVLWASINKLLIIKQRGVKKGMQMNRTCICTEKKIINKVVFSPQKNTCIFAFQTVWIYDLTAYF